MNAALRLAVLFAAVLAAATASADNWPQWRGPGGSGVADAGAYPVQFSAHDGVAWKAQLPGPGSSTPAVWNDSIFVTSTIDGLDGLVCYGFDGQERWRKTLGEAKPGKHRNGSGSNPSPATDGKHVVVYYKSGTVAAFDTSGEKLWQENLQAKYGEDTLWWDLGTSPIIAGKNAVIAVMHAGESYVVALDLATGKEAWKQKRQYQRPDESDQAYTTPQLVNVDGRDTIVVWGADHLTGHDAATGAQLWEMSGFNPEDKPMWRVIASHASENGVAIVPFGRGGYLAGVRLGGKGDVTKSHRLWEKSGKDIAPDVPTPIVHGGRAYVLGDSGRISCRSMENGEEIWSAELPRGRDKYYASPILAGDLLYCVREDGVAFVGRVSRDGFELLTAEGNNLGERVIATPAPVRNCLLVRGEQHLILFSAAPTSSSAGGN
jgi:outer membrane protein assembly factor BamB